MFLPSLQDLDLPSLRGRHFLPLQSGLYNAQASPLPAQRPASRLAGALCFNVPQVRSQASSSKLSSSSSASLYVDVDRPDTTGNPSAAVIAAHTAAARASIAVANQPKFVAALGRDKSSIAGGCWQQADCDDKDKGKLLSPSSVSTSTSKRGRPLLLSLSSDEDEGEAEAEDTKSDPVATEYGDALGHVHRSSMASPRKRQRAWMTATADNSRSGSGNGNSNSASSAFSVASSMASNISYTLDRHDGQMLSLSGPALYKTVDVSPIAVLCAALAHALPSQTKEHRQSRQKSQQQDVIRVKTPADSPDAFRVVPYTPPPSPELKPADNMGRGLAEKRKETEKRKKGGGVTDSSCTYTSFLTAPPSQPPQSSMQSSQSLQQSHPLAVAPSTLPTLPSLPSLPSLSSSLSYLAVPRPPPSQPSPSSQLSLPSQPSPSTQHCSALILPPPAPWPSLSLQPLPSSSLSFGAVADTEMDMETETEMADEESRYRDTNLTPVNLAPLQIPKRHGASPSSSFFMPPPPSSSSLLTPLATLQPSNQPSPKEAVTLSMKNSMKDSLKEMLATSPRAVRAGHHYSPTYLLSPSSSVFPSPLVPEETFEDKLARVREQLHNEKLEAVILKADRLGMISNSSSFGAILASGFEATSPGSALTAVPVAVASSSSPSSSFSTSSSSSTSSTSPPVVARRRYRPSHQQQQNQQQLAPKAPKSLKTHKSPRSNKSLDVAMSGNATAKSSAIDVDVAPDTMMDTPYLFPGLVCKVPAPTNQSTFLDASSSQEPPAKRQAFLQPRPQPPSQRPVSQRRPPRGTIQQQPRQQQQQRPQKRSDADYDNARALVQLKSTSAADPNN